MFDEFFAPLPDVEPYLERIGLAGLPLKGDLETLNKVLYAHVHTVPFENLDAWDQGKVPSLATEDLYEKVVIRRRGGWCHELNALLNSFLVALGYEAYSVGARVTGGIDFIAPIGHHGVVTVIDGKKYYCDVGFGDIAFQHAVPLDGTPSAFGFHAEKNGDWVEIWRDWGKEPMKKISFPDVALVPVDFLFANHFMGSNPQDKFRVQPFLSIMDGDKRKLLQGTQLTEQAGADKRLVTQVTTREEMSAVIKEHFGLDYMPETEPGSPSRA